MKRTILKFSMAIVLMGMFALLPSCKNEAKEEEATETVETTTEPVETTTEPAATEDTTGGKGIVSGTDPAK